MKQAIFVFLQVFEERIETCEASAKCEALSINGQRSEKFALLCGLNTFFVKIKFVKKWKKERKKERNCECASRESIAFTSLRVSVNRSSAEHFQFSKEKKDINFVSFKLASALLDPAYAGSFDCTNS